MAVLCRGGRTGPPTRRILVRRAGEGRGVGQQTPGRGGMRDRSIAIRNVYVMMAYAFRSIRSAEAERIAAERFNHLHDLLAEILVRGVGAQVKRGIHRDYLHRSDE